MKIKQRIKKTLRLVINTNSLHKDLGKKTTPKNFEFMVNVMEEAKFLELKRQIREAEKDINLYQPKVAQCNSQIKSLERKQENYKEMCKIKFIYQETPGFFSAQDERDLNNAREEWRRYSSSLNGAKERLATLKDKLEFMQGSK